MSDVTTRILTCKHCGSTLPPEADSRSVICPPCRNPKLQAFYRRASRTREAWLSQEFICPRCSTVFTRTKHNKVFVDHCEPCRKILRNASRNETKKATNKQKRAERYAREGRWLPCQTCGEMLSCLPTANRLYCGSCLAVRAACQRQEWVAANPDLVRLAMRRRVARRRSRIFGPGYEPFRHREIFDRDGWKCGICRRKISMRLKHPHPMSVSLDHIIPLSQGGQHNRANVRAAHLRCNTARSNKGGGEQLLLVG